MTSVYREIADERLRQEEKWGEQNHPDGTSSILRFAPGTDGWPKNTFGELATNCKERTDSAAEFGELTYSDIFLEEVFEAMAESDQSKLREELVQTAAVAVAWIEKIDRDMKRKELEESIEQDFNFHGLMRPEA